MRKFTHKPLPVEAVQVVSPYRALTHAFPRNHPVKLPSGRLAYYHLVDAVERTKAYPGNWVVRHPDKTVEILTEEVFNDRYEEVDGD